MIITVDVMLYPTCLLTYKSVYFVVTCHRQRSTKLSTTKHLNACVLACFGHVAHIM